MKAIIHLAVIFIISLVVSNSYAMRCNGSLVNEGDSITKMVQVCGQPQQDGQNIVYINKDNDGMNYYIHADSNGVIDSVTFSR